MKFSFKCPASFSIPECSLQTNPRSPHCPLPIIEKSLLLRIKASYIGRKLIHWFTQGELVSLVAGMSVLATVASMLVVVVMAVVVPLVALVAGAGRRVNHNLAVLPVNFRA